MLKIYFLVVILLTSSFQTGLCDDELDEDEDEVPSAEPPKAEVHFEPEDYSPPSIPSEAYFAEFFADQLFPGKWVVSQAKKEGIDEDIAKYNGEWAISSPEKVVLKNDYCLIAKSKARHHAISSKFRRPFSFKSKKPFIIQYDVQFQNGLECGGAYVKLLSGDSLNLKQFNDKTPYTIMFGPDKCGMQSKLHFIIRFKNPKSGVVTEHHAKQTDKSLDSYFTDKKSHLYTLELNADGFYKLFIDHNEMTSGNLMDNLEPSIMPSKEVDDPNDSKPKDWDEREKIPDPAATKPEDWDESAPEKITDQSAKKPDDWLVDEPEYVPDGNAKKPDDWDEEMDGKWEAALIKNTKCEKVSGCGVWTPPMVKNPEFKGKWKAPMINNPAYQGKWTPRKIQNPEYFEVGSVFESLETIGAVGLELWTMTDGIAFDNFLVVDDKSIADDLAASSWGLKSSAEEKGAGKTSMFSSIIQTANDKPWLWAVYLLVILIPIILITIFCFSGSKDSSAKAKKTDSSSPDVVEHESAGEGEEAPLGEENDDELDAAAADQQGESTPIASSTTDRGTPVKSPSKGSSSASKRSQSPRKPAASKADLEEDSSASEETDSANEKRPNKPVGSPRRRVTRKAD